MTRGAVILQRLDRPGLPWQRLLVLDETLCMCVCDCVCVLAWLSTRIWCASLRVLRRIVHVPSHAERLFPLVLWTEPSPCGCGNRRVFSPSLALGQSHSRSVVAVKKPALALAATSLSQHQRSKYTRTRRVHGFAPRFFRRARTSDQPQLAMDACPPLHTFTAAIYYPVLRFVLVSPCLSLSSPDLWPPALSTPKHIQDKKDSALEQSFLGPRMCDMSCRRSTAAEDLAARTVDQSPEILARGK